jgi:hypothetical protein
LIDTVTATLQPNRVGDVSDRRSIRNSLHVLARARVAHHEEREQANEKEAAQEDHAGSGIN